MAEIHCPHCTKTDHKKVEVANPQITGLGNERTYWLALYICENKKCGLLFAIDECKPNTSNE